MIESEKNIPKKPTFEPPPEKSSSSSEDETENDNWQFYAKDFVEPGEDHRVKSVRDLNVF